MAVNKKTSGAVTTKNNTSSADIKKVETAASVKAEVKPEVKAVVKPEAKTEAKPEAKAEAPKQAAAAKTRTKKASKKGAKRGPKAASERTVDLFVQFEGKEVAYSDLVNRIKEWWKAQGKREVSLKSINIYVKPEESMAYCVINDKINYDISL